MAWIDNHAPSMGAALSYYSVFSMAPLLLVVISIAGLVFGREAARNEVVEQLGGLLGTESARAVQDMLQTLSRPKDGVASTLIGAIVLLVGASSVFGELQDALDRIWRAPARDRSGGWIGLIRSRLLSFGMILGVAFLLMVSLVLSAAISAFGKWWGGFFGDWEPLLQAGNALLCFGLTTLVFAMIYKLMPRVAVRWRDVWLGAATTSLLFTIGRFLIDLYIGKTGIASGVGAAGSLAVTFVWVYYSAQIFLLGAEFTWVYANRFGSLKASNSRGPRMAANSQWCWRCGSGCRGRLERLPKGSPTSCKAPAHSTLQRLGRDARFDSAPVRPGTHRTSYMTHLGDSLDWPHGRHVP